MTTRLITVVTVVGITAILLASLSSMAGETSPAAGSATAASELALPGAANPTEFSVWKNDGVGDAACAFDATRFCPSTSTLIALGAPVAVPTLPPSGLVILLILIVTTTAYTLRKQ